MKQIIIKEKERVFLKHMKNIPAYIRIMHRIGILTTAKSILKKTLKIKNKTYVKYKQNFLNKVGLEIGGPSAVFSPNGLFPIYSICKSIDNCNYKENTTWETNKKGNTFEYSKNKKGKQYIAETTNLKQIKSSKYDFVINSHVLEHVANPLKAIKEWKRVLKKGGTLLIIVPQKTKTFDHKRSITKFSHILRDYEQNIEEDDKTHTKEILKYHDFYAEEIKTKEELNLRCKNNFENRNMHHHVFDEDLLKKMLLYHDFNISSVTIELPYHIVIITTKS